MSSGPGIVPHGPTVSGYQCVLSKTGAQLVALGAIATKTWTFGPFPSGCYLLSGYLEISATFDAGLSPTISIGTATYPICCADTVSLSVVKAPTSFVYLADLGGLNPNATVGGDTVKVTVAVGSGNFAAFTTGSFNLVVLVSAPLQAVTAT